MLATLQKLLVDEINRMVADAAREADVALTDIADAVVVGNPTMQHILLGINPAPLGPRALSAGALRRGGSGSGKPGAGNAAAGAGVRAAHAAGYIGGDTLSAVLTRGPEFYRGNKLLVDIGTNGEVVLAKDGVLTATSCATGPVYEVRTSPAACARRRARSSGSGSKTAAICAGRRYRPKANATSARWVCAAPGSSPPSPRWPAPA